MKKLLWIMTLLISFNTLAFAQVYVTSFSQTPSVIGMPGMSVTRVEKGWTLQDAMIFKTDDYRKLQVIIGPSRTRMLPAQAEKLTALSLKSTDEIPEEFYAVPNDRTLLYHCLHSIPRHTLFCKRVIIPPKPSLLIKGSE